jgi:2-dehydropantoate 2-reductase
MVPTTTRAGALGGFYGARLQRSGREVHFLMHSGVEHVRRHGFRVTSPDGDFDLPKVPSYTRQSHLELLQQ